MSVINQMLRDLEKNRQQQGQAALTIPVRPLQTGQRRFAWFFGWVALLLLAVAAWSLGWYAPTVPLAEPEPTPAVTAPVPSQAVIPAQAEIVALPEAQPLLALAPASAPVAHTTAPTPASSAAQDLSLNASTLSEKTPPAGASQASIDNTPPFPQALPQTPVQMQRSTVAQPDSAVVMTSPASPPVHFDERAKPSHFALEKVQSPSDPQAQVQVLEAAVRASQAQQWSEVVRLLSEASYDDDWERTHQIRRWQLQANAQQQLKAYAAAEMSWRRVLQLEAQSAVAWLGLALALEPQGRTVEARQAYVTALQYPGLSAASRQFIQQRLAE